MSEVTFRNYFNSTEAVFKGCKTPKREPDFVSDSGSEYWLQENAKGKYIIRLADHWVCIKDSRSKSNRLDCNNIGSCRWHLKTIKGLWPFAIAGKCYLNDFKKLN